jgi:hemolysin activation/secretion protein
VGQVEIRYGGQGRALVPVEDLMKIPVPLARLPDGSLGSARESVATESRTLSSFGAAKVEQVRASGLRSMLQAIQDEVKKRTGLGVFVVADPDQVMLRAEGQDYRRGASGLTIVIYASGRMTGTPDEAPQEAAAPVRSMPAAQKPAEVAPSAAPVQTREPVGEVRAAAAPRAEPSPAPPPVSSQQATPPPAASPPSEPVGQAPAPVAAASSDNPAAGAPERESAPARARVRPAPSLRVVDPASVPMSDLAPDPAIDGEAAISMTGFEYEYPRPHPDLPPLEWLDDVTVRLVRVADGFIAREGEGSLVRVGDLGASGAVRMYPSAIYASMRSMVNWFGAQGIAGVYIVPDFERGIEILQNGSFDDYRDEFDLTSFPLRIYSAKVSRVRSIASGERIASDDRLNSRKHGRIVAGSPLQPWDGDGPRRDLLKIEPLNTYAYRLSRHPGRRVDVAVANASDPDDPESVGDAEIQYLIQEVKPWTAYFQLSNTGTEETAEWRERFGFVHNQLLGFDDILSLDYSTSNFRESHALIGSYNFPLVADGSVRLNLNGGWTKFKASDVGVQDESFEGESLFFGGELAVTVFQQDDFFVDAYGGLRWQDIEIVNKGLVDGTGQEEIVVGKVGLRAERRRTEFSYGADLGLAFSMNDITGATQPELERLGRLGPDENWTVLSWGSDLSFYLDGIGSWNPRPSPLIHEIATRFSGQYTFNDRLIPNEQAVAGGLYTVRGYPESVVAGDSAVYGSVEYRFHLPRALPTNDNPPTAFGRPFRVAPDGQGGRPDWDLILKVFLDAARVLNSRRLAFESNETLVSTGIGAELVIANNVSFRTDWGIVLDETGSDTQDPVRVGDSRWHFVLTVLY